MIIKCQIRERILRYPDSEDLIDLVLLIEICYLDKERIRGAIEKNFERRKTHEIPEELDNPPENWRERFRQMAAECGMPGDIDAAIVKVRE